MSNHSNHNPFPWEKDGITTGNWLKKAYFAMRRAAENELRPSGLTNSQWQALGIIYHREGITHSELVQLLNIEAPSITSLINGMVKRGWIEQKTNPSDARSKQIFVKKEGKDIIEPLLDVGKIVENKMRKSLNEQEMILLSLLLQKVVSSLE